MWNGDFERISPAFGSLDAIGSKFCVVTSPTNQPRLFTMLIKNYFAYNPSSFALVGALERFSGVSQASGPF
jgi:hypothetical protein